MATMKRGGRFGRLNELLDLRGRVNQLDEQEVGLDEARSRAALAGQAVNYGPEQVQLQLDALRQQIALGGKKDQREERELEQTGTLRNRAIAASEAGSNAQILEALSMTNPEAAAYFSGQKGYAPQFSREEYLESVKQKYLSPEELKVLEQLQQRRGGK